DNIITVYQAGEADGVPFLAMPLLRGETLDKRQARAGGRLPMDEVVYIGRETARGLAAAHRRGLIHRDIKPSNIFLEARDESDEKEKVRQENLRTASGSLPDTNR